MADAVKASGQHMQQEAAHELCRRKCHRLVPGTSFDPVILPAEGHARFVHGHQPSIRDCHAVRITRYVSQHGLGTREWPLGIDHPLALPLRCQPTLERTDIAQGLVLAKELELPCVMNPLQFLDKAPSEQSGEDAHGQEEPTAASYPAFPVPRNAAARYDAMDVRMVR